jgi:Ca2+-binding EF-hand superfamily protein
MAFVLKNLSRHIHPKFTHVQLCVGLLGARTMNKLSIYAGLMVLSVTSAAALHAAPVKADADGNRVITKSEAMASADARFAKIDVNGDGTLNAADRTAMVAKLFVIMDTDKNGAISQSEFMAAHEAGVERRADRRERRMVRIGASMREERQRDRLRAIAMMARADTNGDKSVTQAEYRAAIDARFSKADANQDGDISIEERQAARKTR